jgi:RNA-directed DNA polymerase
MWKNKQWAFRTALFPRVFTEKALLYLVGIKRKDFLELTTNKSLFYKIDKEAKKDGGFREIYKPHWKLKILLRKLNSRFLSRLNLPGFIHCGPSGRSIVSAARGHNNFRLHLSLDVKSFFDSVSEVTILETLRGIGINKEITTTLLKACVESNRLPQGFPTSPFLAALVISCALQSFYSSFERQKILLSIYADDILLSSDSDKLIWKAKNYIQDQLRKVGLQLNTKECFTRNGEQFTWLSLKIYPWVTLPRAAQLALEKRIYEYKMTGVVPLDFVPKKPLKKDQSLKDAFEESLKGKVVFARSINHNQLVNKALKKLETI